MDVVVEFGVPLDGGVWLVSVSVCMRRGRHTELRWEFLDWKVVRGG